MNNASYSKVIIYVIQAGLLLLPFTTFIVPSSMFFPYITGKNIFFRVVVEIIFSLWLVLALIDKRYRPTISPTLYAVTITMLVLILSTIFGVNPYRSFWSNFERMEGLVGLLHFGAYFLVVSNVLKTEIDWKRFFYVLSFAGFLMALYGYMQFFGLAVISQQSGPRIDGTFGNATYMAIFTVFQLFLAAYLLMSSDKRWLQYLLAVVFLFELPVVFLTATRGAILGLGGGLFLMALLLAVFSREKIVRAASFGLIGLMLASVALFWMIKDTEWARQNYVLARFSDLSLQERTVESRFTIWKMSWEGFKERPLLGWGLENYNIVFNKYYNPILWKQEPWFDRSHNVIFDWLISGGLLGLLSYLGIFASALFVLWRRILAGQEKSLRALSGPVALTSLFAAYMFHNLFVFDNLISYYLFFSFIGFIHSQYGTIGISEADKRKNNAPTSEALHYAVISLVMVGLVFVLYFVNVKPYMASSGLLNALKNISSKGLTDIDLIIADFDKVFTLKTFGTGEAREQLTGYANNLIKSGASQENKAKVMSKAIMEMEAQVKDAPDDARGHLFLSSLYISAGRREDALNALNKALELSPKKQQIYFLLADLYLSTNQLDLALDAMRTAYNFDPSYTEAAMGLAVVAIASGHQNEADALLQEHFGRIVVADRKLISAYARVNRFDRIKDTWLAFLEQDPNNVQYRISLAASYWEVGDSASAIRELEKVMGLEPQFKQQGEQWIRDIRAGRRP